MSDELRFSCSHTAGSITCRECAEFLMDYLDGLLPEEQGQRFSFHIERCADCLHYVENYRRTAAMTAELGKCDQPPPKIPPALVAAILAARKQR